MGLINKTLGVILILFSTFSVSFGEDKSTQITPEMLRLYSESKKADLLYQELTRAYRAGDKERVLEIGWKWAKVAEPILKSKLELEEEIMGPNSPYLVKSISKMAQLYHLLGESVEAEKYEKRANKIKTSNNIEE